MITTKTIIKYDAIDGMIDFARAYPDYVVEFAGGIFTQLQPAMLDELGYTPGEVKYPIEWTSEKQRRAYFATNGFGRGIPYERDGRLERSWYTRLDTRRASLAITVANSVPYGPFVVGDLVRGKREDPQQKMHINTGWLPVADTLDFWIGAYNEKFAREYDDLLDQLPIFR